MFNTKKNYTSDELIARCDVLITRHVLCLPKIKPNLLRAMRKIYIPMYDFLADIMNTESAKHLMFLCCDHPPVMCEIIHTAICKDDVETMDFIFPYCKEICVDVYAHGKVRDLFLSRGGLLRGDYVLMSFPDYECPVPCVVFTYDKDVKIYYNDTTNKKYVRLITK